jgi:hypothetical protein
MDSTVGDDFLGLRDQPKTCVVFLIVVVLLAFLILTNALFLITWPALFNHCMVGDVHKPQVYLLHFMPSLPPNLGIENVSHCSLEYLASYGSRFIMG